MIEKTYNKLFNAQRAAKARGLAIEDVERIGPGNIWIVKVPAATADRAAVDAEIRAECLAMREEPIVAAVALVKPPVGAAKRAASVRPAVLPSGLPRPPNFEANTHKPYRAKLASLIQMAEARDVDGLRAMQINPTSTSPKVMVRYRDACLAAFGAA